MFTITTYASLFGRLFQDHKCRRDEWSGWHPIFRFLGFWLGYWIEYFDTWVSTLYLAYWAAPYWASLYCTALVLIPFYVFIFLSLFHIYNPHVRWGWCMLHSSWQNWMWTKFEQIPQTPLIVQNWLYCTMNQFITRKRSLLINILQIPFILHSLSLHDKTRFLEDGIPAIYNAEWLWAWLCILIIFICWQYNLLAECKPLLPQLPDLDPVVRPVKSCYLYTYHFFHWTFFIKNPMPWKFFYLMRLFGIYEFNPNDRSWRVMLRDVHVMDLLPDRVRQVALAHASDHFMWPRIKPDLARGTYQHHLRCEHIYNTSK